MRFNLDKVIGHRGACGHAPENTLISISKAHELGAKWVEFDVMLAGCGEPIIIHDYTLERTTNGLGPVAELDYQQISTLDSGSWFSRDYVGVKIPTLKELLNHAANLDLGINVEIKPHPGKEQATVHQTLESLKAYWPNSCQVPLVSSFSLEVLQQVHDYGVNYRLGYLIDKWQTDWRNIIESLGCTSLHIDYRVLTKERVQEVKAAGIYLLAYTINDLAIAEQLFDWGIDSVFTDFPEKILSIVT